MKSLEMNTVVFIFLLTTCICTVVVTFLWYKFRTGFPGIVFFAADFWLLSLGLVFSALKGILSPVLTILLPNVLFFLGIQFLVIGIGRFYDIECRKKLNMIYFAVYTILYTYFVVVDYDIRIRIMIFTTMTIPIFLRGMFIAWMNKKKRYDNSIFVVVSCGLFAALELTRLYFAFSFGSIDRSAGTSVIDIYFTVIEMMLMILMTFSLGTLIINELIGQMRNNAWERELLFQKLEHLASTDSLTRIFNRRKMEEIILNEYERYRRYGSGFSVLLIDIDMFKRFNDTYGHHIGDRTLTDVVDILKSNIRKLDFIGRWGGEEFMVVLPSMKLNDAVRTAEKLRLLIQNMDSEYLDKSDGVTISIGVVECSSSLEMEELLKRVDSLLYTAKREGRNRVVA